MGGLCHESWPMTQQARHLHRFWPKAWAPRQATSPPYVAASLPACLPSCLPTCPSACLSTRSPHCLHMSGSYARTQLGICGTAHCDTPASQATRAERHMPAGSPRHMPAGSHACRVTAPPVCLPLGSSRRRLAARVHALHVSPPPSFPLTSPTTCGPNPFGRSQLQPLCSPFYPPPLPPATT